MKKRDKGYALLSMLVYSMIGVAVLTAILNGIAKTSKNGNGIEAQLDFITQIHTIQQMLMQSSSCQQMFSGVDLGPVINYPAGGIPPKMPMEVRLAGINLAAPNMSHKKIKFTEVYLQEADRSLRKTSNGKTTYAIHLSINALKQAGFMGSRNLNQLFLVYAQADSSNFVTGCSYQNTSGSDVVPPPPNPQDVVLLTVTPGTVNGMDGDMDLCLNPRTGQASVLQVGTWFGWLRYNFRVQLADGTTSDILLDSGNGGSANLTLPGDWSHFSGASPVVTSMSRSQGGNATDVSTYVTPSLAYCVRFIDGCCGRPGGIAYTLEWNLR